MFVIGQNQDARVVQRVLSGRHNEFGILVERYLSSAQAVARGNLINPGDTEDVTQESFVAAFQKLDTLQSPQKFGPWFLTIVRNTARSWSRRQRRETSLEALGGVEPSVEQPPAEREESRRILEQTLQHIEPEPREILMLHYFAGKSLREIAELYQISREAAAKRLQRARAELGEELLKLVPDEKPTAEANRKRAKAILAVVVASPIAWQAAPAYAATALTAGIMAKWAAAAAVVAGAVTATYFVAPAFLSKKVSVLPETSSSVSSVAASASAAQGAGSPAISETMFPNNDDTKKDDAAALTGNGTLSSVLVNLQEKTVPGGEVTLERITWQSGELPPNQTQHWTTTADDRGRFTFEHLPDGYYSIFANAGSLGGAHHARISGESGFRPDNVKMYPIVPCSGVLQDPTGAPVAGAALYPIKHVLLPGEEFEHLDIAAARATTDEQGQFSFRGLIPGGWVLFVVVPGRPSFYSDPIQAPSSAAHVLMHECGGLSGQVLDARDGEPLPQVKVIVAQGSRLFEDDFRTGKSVCHSRIQFDALADDNGNFHLSDMPAGEYAVLVDDPVLILDDPKSRAKIQPNQETKGLVVRVSTGSSISGQVINQVTRSGVPGVRMTAYCDGISLLKETTTDQGGKYTLTGLPAGHYTVRTSSIIAGYVEPHDEGRKVPLAGDRGTEGIDFELEPGVVVSGMVIDTQGHPVEGAHVHGYTEDSHRYSSDNSVSDAAGVFRMDRLRVSASVHFLAETDEWKSKTLEMPLPAAGLEEIVLSLEKLAASSMEGIVLDDKEVPIARAQVLYRRHPATDKDPQYGQKTEQDGRFLCQQLEAGTYEVSATIPWPESERLGIPSSTSPASSEPIRVSVGDRETVKDIVLRIKAAGSLTITGRVFSPEGKPMPFAILTLAENGVLASVRSDGTFTFEGISEGKYTVYAAAPGYSPAVQRDVEAGAGNVSLQLDRQATLRGRVLDTEGRTPLDAFEVRYTAETGLTNVTIPNLEGKQSFSGAGGAFVLSEIAAKLPLQIEVRAEGFSLWKTRLEPLSPGQEAQIEAVLTRGAGIDGLVVDEAGNALANVYIGNSPPAFTTSTESLAVTDAEGRFLLKELPSESAYTLAAWREGYAPTVLAAPVRAGEVTPVRIVLTQGGALRVRAIRGKESLQAFETYLKVNEEGDALGYPPRSVTAEGGEAAFDHLPAGEYKVTAWIKGSSSSNSNTQYVSAVIVSGQTTEVVADFTPGTARIEGFMFEDGLPAQEGHLYLVDEDGKTVASATPDAQGGYTFGELLAGDYQISAHCPLKSVAGKRSQRETIRLSEGAVLRMDWNFDNSIGVQGVVSGLQSGEEAVLILLSGKVTEEMMNDKSYGKDLDDCQMQALPVNANGSFKMSGIKPGLYTLVGLRINPGSMENKMPPFTLQNVTVAESGMTAADLALP